MVINEVVDAVAKAAPAAVPGAVFGVAGKAAWDTYAGRTRVVVDARMADVGGGPVIKITVTNHHPTNEVVVDRIEARLNRRLAPFTGHTVDITGLTSMLPAGTRLSGGGTQATWLVKTQDLATEASTRVANAPSIDDTRRARIAVHLGAGATRHSRWFKLNDAT